MADDFDWLSSQFGDEPEPEKRPRRRGMPADSQPVEPALPAPAPAPAAPEQAVAPYTPPTVAAPPVAPPAQSGGGFNWGLTPGSSSPEPVVPPAPPLRPASLATPVPPAAPLRPASLVMPATPADPPAPAWDVPTVATPVQADPPPTVAVTGAEVARQEFPGFGTPLDASLDGVTEAVSAQPVGLGAPADEGIEVSAIDSLFGESSFVEYEDALIPVLPPRASGGELVVVNRPRAVSEPRGPMPQLQKVLMGVAGGLVAVLLLVVLFLAGSKIGANTPAPVVADPTPSSSAVAGPVVGPVPPGEYYWDRLLGGECLAPFTSPWADTFTVVDCGQSHPAQLVYTGTFPVTEDPEYPGGDALQAIAAKLCAAPTIIDYAAAGAANDIQILSSFAADADDWNNGNRTFSCFANRTGGAEFTTSIAKPQVAVAETPAP